VPHIVLHTHIKKRGTFLSIPLVEVFDETHKEQNKSKVHAKRHRHFNLISFFASNRQIFYQKE